MADEPAPPPTEEEIAKQKAADEKRKQAANDYERMTKHRLPMGVAGVLLWLLLFSAGVLIPSEPSRKNLGWESKSEQESAAKEAASKKLEQRLTDIESQTNKLQENAEKALSATNGTIPLTDVKPKPPTEPQQEAAPAPREHNSGNSCDCSAIPAQSTVDELSKKIEKQLGEIESKANARMGNKLVSFIVAMFTFTPLNVGILCVLAAFIGGCSVNKNELLRIQEEILGIEAKPPVSPNPELTRLWQRLDYLTEHPGYSAIRGLVVYLVIISGMFIIGASLTEQDGTHAGIMSGQYMKLAGLFSFFGYLCGYDPTVFSSFISFGSNKINSKTSGG